ncbi:MAG: rRNA maturation RNase YbeY, partial [Bdellovibrionales bacterium]
MKSLILNPAGERVPRAWLERWLNGLSKRLARKGFKDLQRKELIVVFVSAREMKRMNHFYRGKDYATDVLSFEGVEAGSVGELILCFSTIKSQAKHTGFSERGELGYMIIHGVLHLLGFDHESP